MTSHDGAMPARISVIIPTKNRAVDLDRCLRSIQLQTNRPHQVVVVDQSLAAAPLPYFDELVYINDPTINGSARARNIGIANCDLDAVDAVLFIDDDTELLPETIALLKRSLGEKPLAAGYQCGDLLTHESGRLHNTLKLIFERGFFDTRPYLDGEDERLRWLEGFAMLVRSDVLRHERFDELLCGYALGEDWEFSQRVRRYGFLARAETVAVYHHASPVNRNNAAEIARLRWRNFNYFYRKLGAARSPMNRIWYLWWAIGETYRWLRAGIGLPFFATDHMGLRVSPTEPSAHGTAR